MMAGDVNTVVGFDGGVSDGLNHVAGAMLLDPDRSIQVSDNGYYVLTAEDERECVSRAELAGFQSWLASIVDRADAKSSDAQALVANAEECVVLACCSWPFRNVRTLVVAVA